MAALTVLGALLLRRVEKESMNDLYNGLMSVTGGASGGLMLLAVFTSAAPPGPTDTRSHTPRLDGRCAAFGIGGSCAVSLLAALCSFGALGARLSFSYYYVLPLSNAAFAACVGGHVLARRCCCRRATTAPAAAHPPAATSRTDGVELIRASNTSSGGERSWKPGARERDPGIEFA